MTLAPAVIDVDEPMEKVMQKFEDTGAWNLPVTDGGRYIGFVSKSKIFSIYRKMLVKVSDE
jgi:CIC family chloride channel protein